MILNLESAGNRNKTGLYDLICVNQFNLCHLCSNQK